MGKELGLDILLPFKKGEYTKKIYTPDELEDLSDVYYAEAVPKGYSKTLTVASRYASSEDMRAYVTKKLGLDGLDNYCISYRYPDSYVYRLEDGKELEVTKEEERRLEKMHYDTHTYCKVYRTFSTDCFYLPDGLFGEGNPMEVIDDEFISRALECLSKNRMDTEELENFLEDGTRYGSGFLAYLVVAKELARRKGGIAIATYD